MALTTIEPRAVVTSNATFRADVFAGFAARPRAISARWLYDRQGSALFERITTLPEYYPTRTERALLAANATEIGRLVGFDRVVVEFGSGSSAKTPLVLGAVEPSAYVGIDISGDYLREAAAGLAKSFPGLDVIPIEADFTRPIRLPTSLGEVPRLGFFPGSTIGNLAPARAVDLLRTMSATLGTDSMLLIGIDRIKAEEILVPAYADAEGITAAFNLNLLRRVNRELDADIPIDAFVHRARWNAEDSRIEMHLEAERAVAFTIDGERFAMAAGETVHTENSYKYDARGARLLLAAGGWTPIMEWTDWDDTFCIILAEARTLPSAP